MLNQLKIKSSDQASIIGLHRLSLCDARGRRAKRLGREIEQFLAAHHGRLVQARRTIGNAMAQGDEAAVRELYEARARLKTSGHRTVSQMYDALRDAALVEERIVKNIVPTVGRAVIARWIVGDNTYSADDGANYGAVGTSNTPPANGDTGLGGDGSTELTRKARSTESSVSNVSNLSVFFNESEANGTIEEGAWFYGASGTPGSGQIASHFLSGSTVKTPSKTLTMQSELTIV